MTPLGAVTLLVDGRPVRVTGGPFCSLPPGAFGLCLEARDPRLAEAAIRLDVPDFGVPDAAALRTALLRMREAMRAEPERAFHIGCRAGLGRTGLAMACLARLCGIEGDAVAWVRTQYDPRAVETPEQEAFVRAFTAEKREGP
ncbi:MAG TPA: hypothetical protein VD970_13915 [Acetobacteraceae bacterium]|nr:hypothetical protein [Acetobacteraceae bacterium]